MSSYLKPAPETGIVRPAHPPVSGPDAGLFPGWGPRL